MDIASISPGLAVPTPDLAKETSASGNTDPAQLKKVSQQFESILVRQFLGESMKSLLEEGESGQVYGYLLNDSLSNSICKAGGLGLSHVLQTQLSKEKK